MEAPCPPQLARARWLDARARGATGAVSSWGSGISARDTLRIFWEILPGVSVPEGEDLVEENWTPYWRKSLRTVAVTDRIALVPAWDDVPAGVPVPVRIDPGMAFGAGDHPSTRLCLRLLENLASSGILPSRALDVGAGTGVLSVAAARLGAGAVDALDIDPFSFAACRRNALLNGLETVVRPLLFSLDLLEGVYPLLLANVSGRQLLALAAYLKDHLATGGFMVLSGFEEAAEDAVQKGLGLRVEDRCEEGGWVGLLVSGGP